MRIEGIQLDHFRNYISQIVEFSPTQNIILGENAQGKTNLLEAIVFLSQGKSPRTRSDKELITFGAPAASMRGQAYVRNREFVLRVDLFRDQRRKMSINGVRAKTTADLTNVLHTVLFQPEDLTLVRNGAAVRRHFLDTALCQLRPRYATALSAYNRAMEQKTRILRDCEEYPGLLETLPEFNEQMIRAAAVILRYRSYFSLALNRLAAQSHYACAGGREELCIYYKTISTITDAQEMDADALICALRRHMEEHQAAERASRQCLSGIHKDDLIIEINGQPVRSFASQGQARTAALSMKLAEREIFKNADGEYPILLLDDVLSELDPRRQEFVLNSVNAGQVFITCCEEDRLSHRIDGRVLRVHDGILEV